MSGAAFRISLGDGEQHLGEVAKIGHNINQIARKLNSGDTATMAQAERTLAAVGTAVRHIAEATNQAVATRSHR
ncbi:plasmid mobilization relaxosome protein MobC [Streptomyces anulatus]|uniref:plasmid mobilization relaxosome protein MobC n=1 Tax=Streptomyces anulatus TaxID=1892 RepID=UPI00365C8003